MTIDLGEVGAVASRNAAGHRLIHFGLYLPGITFHRGYGVQVRVIVDPRAPSTANADRLRVCQVDAGQGALLNIVCGAPNARVGIKVPCALVGAKLPSSSSGTGDPAILEIKKAKLRGVESSRGNSTCGIPTQQVGFRACRTSVTCWPPQKRRSPRWTPPARTSSSRTKGVVIAGANAHVGATGEASWSPALSTCSRSASARPRPIRWGR